MICLLDIDDVLVDFVGQAHRYHRLPYDPENYPYPLGVFEVFPPAGSGLTDDEFWNFPEEFWTTLPWTKEGKRILDLAEIFFDEVYLCSTPTLSPESASGKMKWIKSNMPDYIRKFVLTPAKWLCAGKETLLVDDGRHNTDEFEAKGGQAILVPRPWNIHHGVIMGADEWVAEKMLDITKGVHE